jgi:methionine-S-sulfoxide reductase
MNYIYILIVLVASILVLNTSIQANSDNIPAIDKIDAKKMKTATFAMGCFWGPDVLFGGVEGVYKTKVGYAGGEMENPTYHNLGSHTETIQIEYDPNIISYNELLEIFFNNHNPFVKPYGSQYKSIVFYHDEKQKEIYNNYIKDFDNKKTLYTELKKYDNFYLAEFYHQKYRLQGYNRLMSELRKIYPNDNNFINSTLVARMNYFVGTQKGRELFEKEKNKYGLNEETIDWLDSYIK